jgi:hypothetical protein
MQIGRYLEIRVNCARVITTKYSRGLYISRGYLTVLSILSSS